MPLPKLIIVAVLALSAAGNWLVWWKRVPPEKASQRPMILAAAILLSITTYIVAVAPYPF